MSLIDEFIQSGEKFLKICNSSDYSRFKAWEFCYNKFNDEKTTDIDELSLYLALYLANWGMYRNSFLLETNYKINNDVVKLIKEFQIKYQDDIKITSKEELERLLDKDEFFENIEKLGNDIEKKYKEILVKLNQNKENKKYKDGITDTLKTKIIMGTLGITPACDRFFLLAISEINKVERKTKLGRKFNVKTIKSWYRYYYENYEQFETLRQKTNYPIMKILDMCLWQYGSEITF